MFRVLTVVTLIRFALRQGSWHCSRVHIGPHAQLLLRQPAEHAITSHDMTCSRVWLVGGLQTNISMHLSCPRCSNVNVKVLLITYLDFLRAAHGPVSTMKPSPVQPFCQALHLIKLYQLIKFYYIFLVAETRKPDRRGLESKKCVQGPASTDLHPACFMLTASHMCIDA